MSNYTYVQLRKRTQYLRGETDYAVDSSTTVINDHILFSIRDILNAYPFSFNQVQTTGTITGSGPIYSFNLPSDFIPQWNLRDARIKGATGTTGGDSIFTKKPPEDQNVLTASDYVYWITYSSSSQLYVFNTLTSPTTNPNGATVTYIYQSLPADLVNDSDVCIIPDGEAVCYLAASKMWVGDERNVNLKNDYEQEANARIKALWNNELMFGSWYTENAVVDLNPQLLGP